MLYYFYNDNILKKERFYKMIKQKTNLFVIDTSVILYDAECFHRLNNSWIIIPMIVLEELDKFKNKEGILGENARKTNRFLDSLRKNNSCTLQKGIDIGNNTTIIIESKTCFKNIDLNKDENDNKIIACLNYIKSNYVNSVNVDIILLTKDINLRVKCDALNFKSEDYYADYKFIKEKNEEELYQGYKEIFVKTDLIDKLINNKQININDIEQEFNHENEFFILKSNDSLNKSIFAIKNNEKLKLINNNLEYKKFGNIKPLNKEQLFAIELLQNDNIDLVSLTGVPGSGKTFIALMFALSKIEKNNKQRIIFTRPLQTVGKDIGFLPGTIEEKMTPWLAPIVDNFRNQFGDLSYFEMLMEKEIIDIAPLSHIRGRSFNDSIIIVDEAQNATVHELKTIITRTGKNSKIILLGDIDQIDLAYIDKHSNGLTIVIEKLKHSEITGHINLPQGKRSKLANLAAERL